MSKERRERAKEIAKEYGYLPYMIERYLALWGEDETLRFIVACDEPLKTAIRVNTLKSSRQETLGRLRDKGVKLTEIPWLEMGFYADFHGFSPGALLEYMLGFYYVQGVPSMTAAAVLNPQPGEIVADIAAAPGGKTTHLSQMMRNQGTLVALEQDRLRISSLRSNIMRCGVENSLVYRGDGKKIGQVGFQFDKILLDAPCSGEGLIPIDPSRKTSKTMADIRFCATRENELLDAAARALKPGGQMVYSTCTIAPEENEYIVDDNLRRHPDMRVEDIGMEFGTPGYTEPYGVRLHESLKKARRFLPHLHATEGFFICRLVKEGES